MDTTDKAKRKDQWSWLPTAMPKVAAMVRERRRTDGNAHVNECWRRGVERMEPDWFFAREGAIAIGHPFGEDAVLYAWCGPFWTGPR